MISIRLNNVGHKFGAKTLFSDRNFVFEPGITGISGPNGSGKSTLLQIISGLLTPTSGTVEWLNSGKPMERFDIRGLMGFCAPALSLYEDLTVRENLAFLFKLRQIPLDGMTEMMENWNLATLAELPLKKLSSGQQQRVKLAAAFHPNASLLILDEPSSNLDAENCGILYARILERAKTSTILLASNDADDLKLVQHNFSILN